MKDKYSLYITAETKAKILSEYPNIGLSAAVTHKFMGESPGESQGESQNASGDAPNTQTDSQNTEMDIQNMKMDIQNAIDRLEVLEMWKMDVE